MRTRARSLGVLWNDISEEVDSIADTQTGLIIEGARKLFD